MMTDDQKADWDRWVDFVEGMADVIPPERSSVDLGSLPADLLLAADEELAFRRDQAEVRRCKQIAILVLALFIGAVLGYATAEITRPGHEQAHAASE